MLVIIPSQTILLWLGGCDCHFRLVSHQYQHRIRIGSGKGGTQTWNRKQHISNLIHFNSWNISYYIICFVNIPKRFYMDWKDMVENQQRAIPKKPQVKYSHSLMVSPITYHFITHRYHKPILRRCHLGPYTTLHFTHFKHTIGGITYQSSNLTLGQLSANLGT